MFCLYEPVIWKPQNTLGHEQGNGGSFHFRFSQFWFFIRRGNCTQNHGLNLPVREIPGVVITPWSAVCIFALHSNFVYIIILTRSINQSILWSLIWQFQCSQVSCKLSSILRSLAETINSLVFKVSCCFS